MRSGSAAQRFWHQFKFLNIIHNISASDDVLDFGCGPGSFLALLGEGGSFNSAIGVDLASVQIKFAQSEIGSKYKSEKLKFVELTPNTVKLPFEDASFSAITIIEVIEHIHPYVVIQIMDELKRVLKPDGRIYITTPNYRSLWPFIEWLLNKLSPVTYHDQHINKYTPNSFVKFLETAGFEVVNVESIFVLAPFASSLSWWLGKALYRFEQILLPRLGSLLVAEVRKSSQF